MTMLSRSMAFSQPAQDASDRLISARSYYKRASETLFDLCYQIQTVEELPNPVFLTEAVLHYREARALVEELESRISVGAGHGADAHAFGQK